MSEPAPAWAQTLLTQMTSQSERVTALASQMQHLQTQFAVLSVASPTPPQLSEELSTGSVQQLLTDPRLPDHLLPFARLLELVGTFPLSDEQTEVAKAAYQQLRAAVTEPPEQAPASARARSRTPRNRFLTRDGRTFYTANSGRQFDISAPPPFACRRCHQMHWAWHPCHTPPTPYPGQHYYQNSPMGGPPPAYAPPSR